MHQVVAIILKDVTQWTRRPLYFISSTLLAVLILLAVGSTISGSEHIVLGLYDPDHVSQLSSKLLNSKRFIVKEYGKIDQGKRDLASGNIAVLVSVHQDVLEDRVVVWTEGRNLLIEQQSAMGLFNVLTRSSDGLALPLKSASLFPATFSLRDYVTPGLVAYLCYVIACMNIGFAWIYEWMEKTYKHIILAPYGLRSAILAKTITVTLEASLVLWLALLITCPLGGFTIGNNLAGLAITTVLSMFCFTCVGLAVACFLRTIRIYTMFISICGVAIMFLSGIIVPVEGMPKWEQLTALFLPMYYSADAFKGVMLGTPAQYTRDLLVLMAWAVVALATSSNVLSRQKLAT